MSEKPGEKPQYSYQLEKKDSTLLFPPHKREFKNHFTLVDQAFKEN